MSRAGRKPTRQQQLEQLEQAAQQALALTTFAQRKCLVCGGDAEPISSTQVPAILGRIKGDVSYNDLVTEARRAGFGATHCYTSFTGVSICRSEKPR